MCFSAHASFIVSTVLLTVGFLSVFKARTPAFRLFAIAPIILGIQQALEGFVWICLNRGDIASKWFKLGVYGFQFFAAAFWPLWIPLVLYIMERHTKYKGTLALFSWIGLAMYIITLIAMWQHPATAVVVDHHIRYPFLAAPFHWLLSSLPAWQMIMIHYVVLATYMLLVIGSCFISTVPGMYIFGILFSLAYLAAVTGYSLTFASVWCFFGAVASIGVYGVIIYNNKLHAHR